MLIYAPIMQPLDWSLPFELMCASDYVLEVVLGKRKCKNPFVIYDANKTLSDAQMIYFTKKVTCSSFYFG